MPCATNIVMLRKRGLRGAQAADEGSMYLGCKSRASPPRRYGGMHRSFVGVLRSAQDSLPQDDSSKSHSLRARFSREESAFVSPGKQQIPRYARNDKIYRSCISFTPPTPTPPNTRSKSSEWRCEFGCTRGGRSPGKDKRRRP